MTRNTAVYFDERCLWHAAGQYVLTFPVGGWVQPPAGSGHAESPETKRRFKNLMDVSGLSKKVTFCSAAPSDEADLLRVHGEQYIREFKRLSDLGGGCLGEEAPFGPGGYEIAKITAGQAQAAVDDVLSGKFDNAYVLTRPPGHHCGINQPMGFCLFNNIAIAVEAARQKYALDRIAIVDWDVHHGNGTQEIFYKRPDVLTISLHQDGCFPPGYSGVEDQGEDEGTGFNLNIPLQAGGGHAEYLYAMQRIVLPALDRFQPQLIIVACGFDANAVDPLARMQAHSATFKEMTAMMMQVADKYSGGKLVMVHEGGYAEAYVPFCGHAVVEQLAGVDMGVDDPVLDFIRLQQPKQVFFEFQRQLLDEMAGTYQL